MGNQTLPRGCAPRESLIILGTSLGKNFPDIPFGLFTDCTRLWPKDPISRAPPIPRDLLQQCQTLITGPGGPQGVVGQLASGQVLVWVPGQEERLLPGPGSHCWLMSGCPGYRRILCLSLSHLLEWRGEQWPPCPRATAPCRLTVQCGRRGGRDGWWPWRVGSRRGTSGLSYPCSCNPTPKGTKVLQAFPWRRGRPADCQLLLLATSCRLLLLSSETCQ